MKYVFSNGKRLIVRDVGPVLVEVEMIDKPLPIITPMKLLEDDEARELVKNIFADKNYKRVK